MQRVRIPDDARILESRRVAKTLHLSRRTPEHARETGTDEIPAGIERVAGLAFAVRLPARLDIACDGRRALRLARGLHRSGGLRLRLRGLRLRRRLVLGMHRRSRRCCGLGLRLGLRLRGLCLGAGLRGLRRRRLSRRRRGRGRILPIRDGGRVTGGRGGRGGLLRLIRLIAREMDRGDDEKSDHYDQSGQQDIPRAQLLQQSGNHRAASSQHNSRPPAWFPTGAGAKRASRPHVIPAIRESEGAGIVFRCRMRLQFGKRSRLSLRPAGTTDRAAHGERDPGSAAYRCAAPRPE
ncbi:MAG: hypothetical protein GHHEDOFH_02043 [Pseudorhodoplanes sp.]|nr:hypothetical protein [Pseudorhodoplanes sp.]